MYAVNGFLERAVNGFLERIERIITPRRETFPRPRVPIRLIRSPNPLTVPLQPLPDAAGLGGHRAA